MSAVEPIERIHALLALYRESHYDVELAAGGVATIRVGESAPPEIARWIGAHEFAAFMTACNPHSRSFTHEENEQRLGDLRRQVRERGGDYLAGAGHVPGESWREPSLLVRGLDSAAVDALAREYEQNGILIVPARAPAFLKLYRSDWQLALGPVADVEWAASR
jgi:hypothetical protein